MSFVIPKDFRYYLYLFLSILTLGIAMALIVKPYIVEQQLSFTQKWMASQAELKSSALKQTLSSWQSDVLFLSKASSINRLVHARLGERYDTQATESLDVLKNKISLVFSRYLKTHLQAYQIQLLRMDDVNKLLIGGHKRNYLLHDEGIFSCAKEASHFTNGQVYQSNISITTLGALDTETATICVATPIYSETGHIFGVLLINFDMSNMLSAILKDLPTGFGIYLTSAEDNILAYSEANHLTWADSRQNVHWQDKYSEISSVPFQSKFLKLETLSGFLSYAVPYTVLVDKNNSTRAFKMIMVTNKQLASNELSTTYAIITCLCFMLLLCTFTIFYIYNVFHRKTLREQTMQLQTAILKNAGTAIITTDSKGIITLFNPSAEALLGYSANEIVGKTTPAIFHDTEEIAHRTESFSRELNVSIEPGFKTFIIKSELGLINQHVWTYIRKNEERLQVLLTITALRDSKNIITGYLGIAIDTSQQERDKNNLIYSTELLKTAAKITELGIWQWNLNTGDLIFDEKMHEMYEIDPSSSDTKLYYDDWKKKLHPEDIVQTENNLQEAFKGSKPYNMVFRILLSNNRIRYIHAAGIVEFDEQHQPLSMIGVNRDITVQREYENSLKEAKLLADKANETKSNFLANMSHEIRTPMNAILGMLQLLERTRLDSLQRDYVNHTQLAAKTLLGLLNDILDFSKIEAGKLELDIHPMRIDKLFRDVGSIFAANVGNKLIEIVFDIDADVPEIIMADSLRLQQILINLGGNAIKFTELGEIIIGASIIDKKNLQISVKDTGIGISQEQQETIFEGFKQAEASTARRYGGSGLGLSICQRLAKLMSGSLEVTSELGCGSEFCLIIPLIVSPMKKTLRLVSELHQLHALLVEDNLSSRRVIGKMLSNFGWSYDEASNGYEAIELVEKNKAYDVIFMDWKMPGMSGWVASQYIKLIIKEASPVIIMITAHGREVISQNIIDNPGVLDGFLVKPITGSMLFNAVANARCIDPEPSNSDDVSKNDSTPLHGLRILLVEDNQANRFVACELLKNEGAEVVVADCGLTAINLVSAEANLFDIIIMDVQMPDMDGYAVTRTIRQQLGLTMLPIIAMTANAMDSDRLAAFDAGMNDHVPKPIEVKILVNSILRLTKHQVHMEPDKANNLPPITSNNRCLKVKDALNRFQGNQSIYNKTLSLFINDSAEIMVDLTESIANNKPQQVNIFLHTLKGIASTVGAMQLASMASELEHKSLKEVQQKLADLESELHQAVQASQDILSSKKSAKLKNSPKMGLWREEIRELIQLLTTSNMKAINYCEEIQNNYPDVLSKRFKKICNLVNQLAFKEAADLCSQLLDNE